jgi:hypothetical protein
MIGCALAMSPVAARAQDHQHASPDSASTNATPMPMEMMGMMGQMMTTMAHMHDTCRNMTSPGMTLAPTDSVTADPMGMMGQMMTTMGRMMTMMSGAGGMTHGPAATVPESLTPPDSTPPRE